MNADEPAVEHNLPAKPVHGGALPPGPRTALLTAAHYVRDPFAALLEAGRRYGDPFTWPTFLGPIVVTGDPDGIKDVLTADPDVYTALGAELLGPVLGANNLILLSGDPHRAMRRFYNPHFHGERLRDYGAAIARIALAQAARWPTDRPFAVEETMRDISLEVILDVVLGLGDPVARAPFKRAVLELIGALKPSFMFIPAFRRSLLGLGAWARFRRRAAAAVALLDREVAARRADAGHRTDVLSLLIAAQGDGGPASDSAALLEQVISLLGAGHETTASALTWALFHIHRDRAVRDRLLDELGGAAKPIDPLDVARLPYLDAVCSEALRLDPVAPLIGRTVRTGMTLKGHAIPAGVSVGIGIINLHRRPDLYPQPEQFSPERFLGGDFGPFEYLPFGGGSRRCLGAAFAVYEMKIVLATILRAHALRLTRPGPVRAKLRNTTAAPAATIKMIRVPQPTR